MPERGRPGSRRSTGWYAEAPAKWVSARSWWAPPGSGVYFPDALLGNVAKLSVGTAFWRMMVLAGDIGGGLFVTMPSLKDLENPETARYVETYLSFGSETPAEEILKITKLLQNWPAWGAGLRAMDRGWRSGPPPRRLGQCR